MFKVIHDKKDFIQCPELEMNEKDIAKAKTDTINLFGDDYRMYADEWKHHVHIKCTDTCDANCDFCIEKDSLGNPQNPNRLLASAKRVLAELALQGQLRTVSITGGEPTEFSKFEDLVNLVLSYKTTLVSINTNGHRLDRIPRYFDGWLDISKHAIDDRDVFKRDFLVTKDVLRKLRERCPNAKIRFQCVLGVTDKMKTLGDIINFILEYQDAVDDFSFRNLIVEGAEHSVGKLMLDLRQLCFEYGEFVEQAIQDYYVYEVYKLFGKQITISWSNMKGLKDYNESHDSNFLEEIIVHPDGTVCGSWNKKSLIICKPEKDDTDEYPPCRGVGCDHHCRRYIDDFDKMIILTQGVTGKDISDVFEMSDRSTPERKPSIPRCSISSC